MTLAYRSAHAKQFLGTQSAATKIEAVTKMILDNSRITIREFPDDVAYRLVHDKQYLGTKCAATEIVPKLQNF